MAKVASSCNWVKSWVTEETLNEFFIMGVFPAEDVINWRVPGNETTPKLEDVEIIVFTDHLLRGFSLPGSKFFRDALHSFNLHPQDIGTNSVTNLCQLQTLYEAYLQEEPSVDLFKEYFYINRQTEMADGLSLELGGVTLQRRRDVLFPAATLPSHPKEWNKTWFYCKDTSPKGENPLPGYHPYRLNTDTELPDRMSAAEHVQYGPAFSKIRALLANGLTGVDLTRCWVSCRILPLSRRSALMCQYTGEVTDPQCFNQTPLIDHDLNTSVKSLLGEPQAACSKTVLSPFYALNSAPDAGSSFWNKRLPTSLKKKSKASKAIKDKAPARRMKQTTEKLFVLDDSEEEAEDSEAGAGEVTIISSDLEPLPTERIRRVIRKVKFSHPLAHLDPDFLFKKQQFDARCQTWSGGFEDLVAGLSDSPARRKRRNEETPPSSGDSTASKLPPLVINPGAQAKKRKLGGSSSRPDISEPEDPKLATPETQVEPSNAGQGTHDTLPSPTSRWMLTL